MSKLSKKIDKYLHKIYYNPELPGSFSSHDKLWRYISTLNDKPHALTKLKIKQWVESQDTHSIHKQLKIKFKREKIIVGSIGELWESDLIDLSMLKEQNNGFRFIFVCIDAFSKYIWLKAIKNKTAIEVKKSFQEIFSSTSPPLRCHTDLGKEYDNKLVKSFMKKNDVYLYFSQSEKKCPFVERAILNIKRKLFKIFYHRQSYSYLDVLSKIQISINSTYNRSIGMAPKEVNSSNEIEIYMKYYMPIVNSNASNQETKLNTVNDSDLKPGTPVRVSYKRGKFSRGYNESYSEEIMMIKYVIRSTPKRYVLEDLNGNVISSSFYKEEISPTNIDSQKEYKISKILKYRKVRGKKKEVLVSWYGWPESYNSWIPAASIKDYKYDK
jgi:hypothetical protein